MGLNATEVRRLNIFSNEIHCDIAGKAVDGPAKQVYWLAGFTPVVPSSRLL